MDMPQGDPMGGQTPPPMEDPMGQGPAPEEPNPYEADFDAGVDADEQEDPKRFIQQVTGKLSQSLRSYNEQLPQPDADLNKYVAGMVVKQAIEGLSQEDVDEILNKVKSDEDMEEPSLDDGNGEQQSSDMSQQQPPQQDQQIPTESIDRRGRNCKISELFQELTNGNQEQGHSDGLTDTNNSYRNSPFSKPKFS